MVKNGALYHVTARANRKEMIFEPHEIKVLFLNVLKRARKKYNFRIENFCILGNHFHMMLRPGPNESLSRIMQWIMSVFAMAFNRIYGYWGHVWGSRFFSRILVRLSEYIKVFDYIDRNPVSADLVEKPQDWRYCGFWNYRQRGFEFSGIPDRYLALVFPGCSPLLLPM